MLEVVAGDDHYRRTYEELFGALPELSAADDVAVDTAFANIGKAIAAFERTVLPEPSRFDEYVAATLAGDFETQQTLFSVDEVRGQALYRPGKLHAMPQRTAIHEQRIS